MKDSISQLKELQDIDLKISRLDKEISAGYKDIDKRRAGIAERRSTIELLLEKIAAADLRRLEVEAEVATETDRLKDRQAKLMNVQTNREYQSLLKESEDIKKANKEREENVVLLMEQLEALKTKIDEENNVCGAEEELLTEETAKVEKEAAKLSTERDKIMKARESKAKAVPAALLKKYTMIRDKRNGLAVVAVSNNVCRGCFMNIPSQLYNDLMKEDRILACPTCNRIMFHQTESREE